MTNITIISFTLQAVCALASVCPIVTPQFLDDVLKACETPGEPMPKTEA